MVGVATIVLMASSRFVFQYVGWTGVGVDRCGGGQVCFTIEIYPCLHLVSFKVLLMPTGAAIVCPATLLVVGAVFYACAILVQQPHLASPELMASLLLPLGSLSGVLGRVRARV